MRPFLILNSLAIEFFLSYFNVNKYIKLVIFQLDLQMILQ